MSTSYGDAFPSFPRLRSDATEETLERVVEKLTDRGDAVLMAGSATQQQYDEWMRALDAWSARQQGEERLRCRPMRCTRRSRTPTGAGL